MKRSYWLMAVLIVALIVAMNLFAQDPIYYEEFDEGLGTWWIGFESGQAEGIYSIDDTPEWLSGDASLMIEILDAGTSNWHVQALDHLSGLVAGTSYDVTFLATTDSDNPINCDVVWSLPVDPWTTYQNWNYVLQPDARVHGPFTWVCEVDGAIDLKFWPGDNDPVIVWLDSIVVIETPANSVGDKDASAPGAFALEQNYPNPFNPGTTISYRLAEPSDMTLNVYNLEGQMVRSLYNGPCTAGPNQVSWDGLDMNNTPVSSGVYIYRMDAQGATRNFSDSNKMFLVK